MDRWAMGLTEVVPTEATQQPPIAQRIAFAKTLPLTNKVAREPETNHRGFT